MNNNMITSANDKFNRSTFSSNHAFIANNKLEVALDRYPNIKGTEIERLIRNLASIMAEADRHLSYGDTYFDYLKDKITAEVRINMIISLLYKKEGNIEKIEKDICFKNGKVEVIELSDHYWAIPHNN